MSGALSGRHGESQVSPGSETLYNRSDGPLLSVVVPVFGVEAYLDDCLNSLVAQGIDQEIIVVIDASPDRSVDIAREFAARFPEVLVVENEVNVGLGAARNIGMRKARGKYVTFPDSDDIVAAGAYREMLERLERTGSDFATASADEFGTPAGRARYWTTRHEVFDRGAEAANLDTHPELVWDHTAWTKVFRREFLTRFGIEWPEGTKCEDVVPSMRAYSAATAIDVVPRTSILYRRRPGSITTSLASSQTLTDWAVQTAEALELVRGTGAARAAQEFAEKILSYELGSRIQSINESAPDVRELALKTARAVLDIAEPATLRRVDPRILEGAFRALSGMDPATAREDMSEPGTIPAALLGALNLAGDRPADRPVRVGGEPLVSVVMPTYNVASWIDECIRSVVNQSMGDLELIIVDDHSTDATWSRVIAWAERDERIRAVRNPGRGGAQARNAGVELATGHYLIFCDGDDIVPRRAYATLTEMAESAGADVTVGGFQRVWTTTTWSDPRLYGFDRRSTGTTLHLNPRLIRNRTCWNRLIRRDFWIENKIHFPTTPRGNDMLPMTMAMRAASSIAVTPEIVYHYRARPGGSSMTARLNAVGSLVGYFVQERLCAVLVVDDDRSIIAREYWHMALGSDAWVTLGKLLESGVDDLDDQDALAVTEAVAGLVDLASYPALERIGPRRALVFLLAARGHLRLARESWLRETGGLQRGRASVESAMRCLTAALDEGFDRRLLARLWHDEVLRPFIDHPDDWDDTYADTFLKLGRRIDTVVPLRETATPGTKEVRVVEATLLGGRNDLWRETARDPYRYRPKLAATVVRATGRNLELRSARAVAGGVDVMRLEFVGHRGGAAPTRARGFGGIVQDGADWSVAVDLSDLPARFDWRPRVRVRDRFGELELPLGLDWDAKRSSSRTIRRQSISEQPTGFRTFGAGAERLGTALEWRLEKARKMRVYRAIDWRIRRVRRFRQQMKAAVR